MYKKKFKKARGKVNKIPLNVLRKPKGQRRTRPRAYKELITLHTFFVEYENSKDNTILKQTDQEDIAQYEEASDSYNYDQHDSSLPTRRRSYVKRKIKAAEQWEEVRAGVQKIILCRHSLDENAVCLNCQKLAVVRCQQCGPYQYCVDCSNELHHSRNFHHSPEIWKVAS